MIQKETLEDMDTKDGERKRVWLIAGLLFMIGLCLSAYTCWLAAFDSLTTRNLSTVGYWLGYRKELILWGVFCGTYFVADLVWLGRRYRMKTRVYYLFVALAGVFLATGVLLPYQPDRYPLLSNVHIGCSLMAPFCLLAAMFILLVSRKRQCPRLALVMVVTVSAMGGAAGIFIHYTIITSVLEIYTVTVLTVLMTWLAVISVKL